MLTKLPALIWTVIAVIGVVQIVGAYFDAREDRRVQRVKGYNGELKLIVDGDMRAAQVLMGPMILILVVGLLALLAPVAPRPDSTSDLLYEYGIAGILVLFEGAVVYVIHLRRHVRQEAMEIARRRELGVYPLKVEIVPHMDGEPWINYKRGPGRE